MYRVPPDHHRLHHHHLFLFFFFFLLFFFQRCTVQNLHEEEYYRRWRDRCVSAGRLLSLLVCVAFIRSLMLRLNASQRRAAADARRTVRDDKSAPRRASRAIAFHWSIVRHDGRPTCSSPFQQTCWQCKIRCHWLLQPYSHSSYATTQKRSKYRQLFSPVRVKPWFHVK